MNPFIIVTDGMDKGVFNSLKSFEGFQVHPEDNVNLEKLGPHLESVEALVIRSKTKLNQDILSRCPSLKIIVRAGEGTDNIDKQYCKERGIRVSNTPGANAVSVVEYTLGLILSTLRMIPKAQQTMQEGLWQKSSLKGRQIKGNKAGIIGLGHIGKGVAQSLEQLGAEVGYFDPVVEDKRFFRYESLDDLFLNSLIISVHVPLNNRTNKLIGANLLQKMQRDAVMVNTSRGGVVDEAALECVPPHARICLDVFEKEPLDEKSLTKRENIFLSPHIAGSSEEAQKEVSLLAFKVLENFFVHKEHLYPVSV